VHSQQPPPTQPHTPAFIPPDARCYYYRFARCARLELRARACTRFFTFTHVYAYASAQFATATFYGPHAAGLFWFCLTPLFSVTILFHTCLRHIHLRFAAHIYILQFVFTFGYSLPTLLRLPHCAVNVGWFTVGWVRCAGATRFCTYGCIPPRFVLTRLLFYLGQFVLVMPVCTVYLVLPHLYHCGVCSGSHFPTFGLFCVAPTYHFGCIFCVRFALRYRCGLFVHLVCLPFYAFPRFGCSHAFFVLRFYDTSSPRLPAAWLFTVTCGIYTAHRHTARSTTPV